MIFMSRLVSKLISKLMFTLMLMLIPVLPAPRKDTILRWMVRDIKGAMARTD